MNRNVALAIWAAAMPLAAQVQTCSGSQDFFGPYVFVAQRAIPDPAAPATVEAPPPNTYSNTAMGQIARGAVSAQPFAITGRFVSDGLGNLLAGPPDSETLTVRVGAYTINGDCTMSVTLVDGFRSGLDLLGDPLPGSRSSWQGILQNRGDEATFVQTGAVKGAVLQLFRPQFAANCSQTTLSGVHGLLATGLQMGTTEMPAIQPLALMGRILAENGQFKLDLSGMESKQPDRQFTGSYRVEADCTGSGELAWADQKLKINFVLVRNGVLLGGFRRAELRFAFQDTARIGTGVAR
ncbi:MAG: hypothetical protein R2729_28725 [Bryobacteraceae bacterium]